MTASSVSYLTETAKLRNPIRIQQSIARPNLTFSVHEIRSGFDDLNFMIPDSAFLPHQIPLGMVFIDNINHGMDLVTHFRSQLPNRLRPRGSVLIRIFNGELDAVTRKTYLADFRSGETRILVGTDAMGMGIDVKRIETVAQWGISPILKGSVLYQRLGRAGRDRTMSAYGKIFVQSRYLVDNMSQAWLEANGIDDMTLESMLPTSGRPRKQPRVPPIPAAKSYKRFKELLTSPVDQIHAANFRLTMKEREMKMFW
jgi:superfamily II DNA helicase RecQ